MHTVPLPTLQDTLKLASKIAKLAKVGDVITLRGELGAGKTAFARAFIQSLKGSNQEVPSPTFTLLQVYELPKFTVYHFDLYRLTSADEVFELGIEEAFAEGVSIIEWPEIIESMAMPNRLDIEFNFKAPAETRQAQINLAPSWQQRWQIGT